MTALAEPFGSPSTSRKTISTGRSMIPCSAPVERPTRRAREIVPLLLGEALGQKEIEQVAELDRLCLALVRHGWFLLLWLGCVVPQTSSDEITRPELK